MNILYIVPPLNCIEHVGYNQLNSFHAQTDDQLLTHLNTRYPQSTSWTMRHLRLEMHSALTSAMLRKWSQPESYLPGTKKDSKLGESGWHFASPSMLTPIFRRWPTLSYSCKPLACGGETVESPRVTSPCHPACQPEVSPHGGQRPPA